MWRIEVSFRGWFLASLISFVSQCWKLLKQVIEQHISWTTSLALLAVQLAESSREWNAAYGSGMNVLILTP